MPTRLINNMRSNVAAYLALFISLGGSSWAAVNLPAGSVGARALQNHSITPVKFNRQFINGTVRAWVVANANGTVQAGAGKPIVQLGRTPGTYSVSWKNVGKLAQRGCFPISGVTSGYGPGFTTQVFRAVSAAHQPRGVFVGTYDAQGQPSPESFYVALIC